MQSNSQMLASINITAEEFARRHSKTEDKEIKLMQSRYYLKEETPAVMWLAAKRGYNFIAYPGDMIEPFKTAKELFVNPSNTTTISDELIIRSNNYLVHWLDIHFKRIKSQELLRQTEILNAPSKMALKAPAISMFAKKSHVEPINEEQDLRALAKNILNAPGDAVLKIKILLETISALEKSIQKSDTTLRGKL